MWGDSEPRRESARRAAIVFFTAVGAVAALVGAGAIALVVWASHFDVGLGFNSGDWNLSNYTGPTLPRQRGDECVHLHAVRDAAIDARDIAGIDPPTTKETWHARQARIEHALLVFDLQLAAAEQRVPPQLGAQLRDVRMHVERGRIDAATASGETAYVNAVGVDVIQGYISLSNASAILGSGCGANFELAPPAA